jgi:alpha-galactosidase
MENMAISKKNVLPMPAEVTALVNNEPQVLAKKSSQAWAYQDLLVELHEHPNSLKVDIQAPHSSLSSVCLVWDIAIDHSALIMNDHWERTYGDVSWHPAIEGEILPWYFMVHSTTSTIGFGVKTGTKAFCSWQITPNRLILTLDTRNGGSGVFLGERILTAAEIVTILNEADESPWQTCKCFAAMMCSNPRLPHGPIYGINDWYFAYGNNSKELILEHTELLAPLADGLANRPFSMVDAGWYRYHPRFPDNDCWGDSMIIPNDKFGDMAALAKDIRKIGMRPGIWTRPLCASHSDATSLLLPLIKGREADKPVLDPTISENMERIINCFKIYRQWSYDMVKFDFTSFDLFGRWGFEMRNSGSMTVAGWRMYDTSKTNAEIVLDLYKAIREAAGDALIIGCNTFSHLSAGLFELNRIGDDTSGLEWDRTKKMGVNTLAFRSFHQGVFYAADADCVALTEKVEWNKTRQWLELVTKSGTPLFISAQPAAIGPEQKAVIKECMQLASEEQDVAEPLDWMENRCPRQWYLNGNRKTLNWD